MLVKLLRHAVRYATVPITVLAVAAFAAGAAMIYALSAGPALDREPIAVPFSIVHDRTNEMQFTQALRILSAAPSLTLEHPTNRSELPFWLLSQPVSHTDGNQTTGTYVVDFPSRHIQKIEYWVLSRDQSLIDYGKAVRDGSTTANIQRSRAGFVLSLPETPGPVRILVKTSASGPGRLSLFVQPSNQLSASNHYFDRSGGVLFGSLLMIAAFSGLIALLAKDFTFFLFGAWVISSLRFSSYSSGWDLGWLGFQWVESHQNLARNLPLSAYAVFTVALFWSIFRRDIATLKKARLIRVLLIVSLLLVPAALIIPHERFLPILWVAVVPSVALLIWLTAKVFVKTGSRVAAWYAASWIATLSGALSEVAFASGLLPSKPTLIGSLGGSIVSALLVGIALGQRINSERSGRISAQERTLRALSRFRENYNSMPVGLFSLGPDGSISLYNPAFSDMLLSGYAHSMPESLRLDSLLGPGAEERIRHAASIGHGNEVELEVIGPNAPRWFLARVSSKDDSIEGSIQDITTRKQAEASLRHLVDHDPLTGLLNRRGLEEGLAAAHASVSNEQPCAIAHVDLDRFKLTNDLYGHATGDALLQAAAQRLTAVVRATDYVARIADSFVVVLMECPESAVMGLTERLRESISDQPFDLNGKSLNATVSIGVVTIETAMSPVDAMAAADRACSEAKRRGRNCVVRLNEQDATLRSHLEELRMVANLQQRIQTDRYFLEFQPIVELGAANQSLNYEVLIRMRGADGGVVPPSRFIGAAERNGLMSEIDRWVLRSTLEWLDAHPAHRDRLSFATINLSGASLNDARFISDAFSMISEHPLAMTKLCFEVTESVALHDVSSTRRFVERVRAYGSKVALDDFGAGYTSFNYLKELPADFIKIDGSFVRDINQNPANYAITRTIVDLTHELGMSSIAEWAESADTVAALIELGVDYGQGFALAKPMATQQLATARSSGALVQDAAVQALLAHPERRLLTITNPGQRRR